MTPYKISRRQFVRGGVCGAMGLAPLINVISQLQLINCAAASTSGNDAVGADYKALVCIFLRGGCDMNNVLIPISGNQYAQAYTNERGAVAIPNGISHPTYNPSGADETIHLNGVEIPLGLHASMPNLASMFHEQEAAFLTNVGTLAEPTTKSTYGDVVLPNQLFSHSNQQIEWMSSIADQETATGWGGRVAELYHDTWNESSSLSMLVTAAGNNTFLSGSPVSPQYTVTSSGAVSLVGYGTNYAHALDASGNYKDTPEGRRLRILERMMSASHSNLMEESYSTVFRRAREAEDIVSAANQASDNLGFDPLSIFSNYGALSQSQGQSNIGRELLAVAKLIAGRKCLGNKRQIFFVDTGTFDTHSHQRTALAGLLGDIDRGVAAFNDSMKQLAALDADFEYDKVTTFQASDFNRTWTSNGNESSSAGTDHAWGSHAFIFGGAVKGGKLYGTFPQLGLAGPGDVPRGDRGRWIPSTSVDEYSAILANWFGVPATSGEMSTILPNLSRFENPFGDSSEIRFL